MDRSSECIGTETLGVFIRGEYGCVSDGIFRALGDGRVEPLVVITACNGGCRLTLRGEVLEKWGPNRDTARIAELLNIQPRCHEGELELEIMIAMFGSPEEFLYQSFDEFLCAVRVRRNIVREAWRTQLAFSAKEAERPKDYWDYSEERGFVVKAGKPIIRALREATQPCVSGMSYSFSCYRATEYVTLLALALELEQTDSFLLARLQEQMETEAIKSRRFHDVFLREYGSMEKPLPKRFYVPGDRVWFRNPDPLSSDVGGYEGSWVFYLGSGYFSNFWKRSQPYTLDTKCIEIFHWRHGLYVDADGVPQIDEAEVDRNVLTTLSDPLMTEIILDRMLRYRDNSGEYLDGGCIDTTRECVRYIGRKSGNFLEAA